MFGSRIGPRVAGRRPQVVILNASGPQVGGLPVAGAQVAGLLVGRCPQVVILHASGPQVGGLPVAGPQVAGLPGSGPLVTGLHLHVVCLHHVLGPLEV